MSSTTPTASDLADLTDTQLREVADRVPASGRRVKVLAITAVATLGSFLFGYDTGVISGALPYMYMPHGAAGLALTSAQEGRIAGFLLVGAAFGALLGARMSDRWGRRHNLLLLAVLFVAGALGTTAAPNLAVMYLARFVLGFAVGGASATVPVYLAETAPKRIRGSIMAVDQFMIVTGQLVAFTMNAVVSRLSGGPELTVTADPSGRLAPGTYSFDTVSALQASKGGSLSPADYHAFLEQLTVSGGNGSAWRWMLVLCTIPALALWIGIRRMPETSRWYLSHSRLEEAVGSLKRVRNEAVDGPVAEELAQMVASHRAAQTQEGQARGLRHVLATPWLRKLLAVGIFLAIVNQTTGVNTVMYYAPKVLEYAGMSASASITAQIANGVMSVVGAFAGIWIIQRFRRRQILIADVLGVGACLLTIAAIFRFQIAPAMASATTAPAWAAWAILALMGVFMLIVQSSNGTVVWTMMGELFPTNVRGAMNGTAIFCMWIANAALSSAFPWMMENLGGAATYTLLGVLNLVIAMVLYRIMPETSGKSLEEIEVEMRRRYA